ncbi:hypothetical protein BDV96DRAFT_537854 [Lophiotrema nucula]|uniref:Uncharacterized protein n=1 Tax=Lophiotrema nucula TaxID=690887 RepID=A0A6A5ZSK7_9PLEO|nr:hypothetical protein BDV96DRAFT_537854 [Lophiotrema nucula]
MECLTALGLAANIIQFVEFGTRLLSEANEVYYSATGMTKENVETQEVADDLRKLADCLVIVQSDPSQGHALVASSEINRIAMLAKEVAAELIQLLDKVAIQEGSNKRWRSFRQALLNLRFKDKIDVLQKRLNTLRDQLSAHTLAYISGIQTSLVAEVKQLKIQCEDLNTNRKNGAQEMLHGLQDISDAMQKLTIPSLERIEVTLGQACRFLDTCDKERQILESLRFDTMRHRYHAITDAHRHTFEWLFRPPIDLSGEPSIQTHFSDWLTRGSGVYWVSGKPGSGKSTLMKYICDSPETSELLRHWAQTDKLVTASFYFWTAGTEMQRCQRGLLQQLLFEILRECPSFIPTVCSKRWSSSISDDWTLAELRRSIQMLEEVSLTTKICFFIDGLDEYDGDHMDLIQVLRNVAKNPKIKICISSRPWPCFEDAFGTDSNAKLYLHQLTYDDIARFAQDKLEEIPGFAILKQERQVYKDLVSDISRKAQGVFLWVYLCVRSLRGGLLNGDSLSLLRQRLDEIPSDLELFFDKLIESVDTIYRKQMAIAFEVAIRAPQPLKMIVYWYLDECADPTSSSPPAQEMLNIPLIEDRMSRRLSGCYKGLLEGTGPLGSQRVQFIHRTIHDYLQTRTVSRLFGLPESYACSKALGAILAYAHHSQGGGVRRFDSNDVGMFLVFAQWAQNEPGNFDWTLVEEMDQLVGKWYSMYSLRFLLEAVRFGFVAYLQHRHQQDGNFIRRFQEPLLRAAFETQLNLPHEVFGIQSNYDLLTWLLKSGADPNLKTDDGTLFLEYLKDYGVRARRSKVPWAYPQLETSLSILLRYGANFNDPFDDLRFLKALPRIGPSRDALEDITSVVDNKEGGIVHKRLHRELNVYDSFLENGLDPNRQAMHATLWEVWLWYIIAWQSDHGFLEDICVRAMRMFLSYGANPFQQVHFTSDRVSERHTWTVSLIVDHFFTQEARKELVPSLESAIRRWKERQFGESKPRKRRLTTHQTHCDYGQSSAKRIRRAGEMLVCMKGYDREGWVEW